MIIENCIGTVGAFTFAILATLFGFALGVVAESYTQHLKRKR